ncbi:putative phospholipase B-like 2 [Eriocheir sinensis]|uniref:putative phospholipase B-like 2 n=1 Tax=Eriocheir sinensis TaxID=95602 RepID=UPI0021C58582|nr:putative phospholipase B-like 2 [Eriocheir sinensis]XP_050733453.1 putative phospholipase B-like 2 [Eriocheir sinensis]
MNSPSVWRLLCVAALLQPSLSALLSVTFDGSKYYAHEGITKTWVATGSFFDNTTKDGWGYLEIKTNPAFPDTVQAYAAGFAEGVMTTDMIYKAYRNTMEGLCEWKSKEFCENLKSYLETNFQWMEAMIAVKGKTCPVWHNVELILAQLRGINDGYNKTAKEPMMEGALLLMNLAGDLEDLETALSPKLQSMSLKEWVESGRTTGDGHCSALIKLLPGNTDLYVSHVTWNTFQSMLRILKKYIMPFRRTGSSGPKDIIPGHTVSFSSYPGILSSGDDYYILSSGLVSLETTIGNGNPALWKNVTATGELQEWIRTIVANRVAADGKSWSDFFSMHNSGTYNNQWMVVDYKLFKPGKAIRPNTLWVLEQLPGTIVADDQSDILSKQSYWPSYNAPFYKTIFNLSGAPAMVERYGDWFTYDKTPRALIFKRDHISVKNLKTMIKLMRYNNFQHDQLSRCNCTPPYSGENAISARNDLNPKNGTYPFGALGHRSHGGTDMKVTNLKMASQLSFLAVNGPTYDQQPVFRWSEQDFANNTPHYGHPDAWKFPVIGLKWLWQ